MTESDVSILAVVNALKLFPLFLREQQTRRRKKLRTEVRRFLLLFLLSSFLPHKNHCSATDSHWIISLCIFFSSLVSSYLNIDSVDHFFILRKSMMTMVNRISQWKEAEKGSLEKWCFNLIQDGCSFDAIGFKRLMRRAFKGRSKSWVRIEWKV